MFARTLSRFGFLALLSTLPGSVLSVAHAQFPTPTAPPPMGLPIHQTFLTSDDGWLPIGDGAKVSVVPNPISVNSVNGALKLDYSIAPGQVTAFLLPIGNDALRQAQSFRFEVRADYAAKLVFGIQEQGGGRYVAFFQVPKDKWQTVELTPADFQLTTGPDDPKDPDNKLDLDQVQFLGLIDAGSLFAMANNPTLNDLFGISTGAHHLYLADFQVTATPLPGAAGAPLPANVVDAFTHPQIDWLTLGGIEPTVISGDPLPGRGLSLKYVQAPAKASGAIHFLPRGKFAGATKLSLDIASVAAANLFVQIEDGTGNKFNTQVYVPAGAAKAETVSVSFADFKPADDSKNKTAPLDLTAIDRLLILDGTAMLGNVTQNTPTTLSIGSIRLTCP